jgi:murein hydrolase activator
LFFSGSIWSQTEVDKVKKQKEKTLKEIEYANKLLDETRDKTKASLAEINLINQKLKKRQEYINALEAETALVSQKVDTYSGEISRIEEEILRLKKIYADLVVRSYKNQWKNYYLMYFLASDNLNQFYQRLRFVRIYYSYIESQKTKLDELKSDLIKKNNELRGVLQEKNSLMGTTKKEYSKIQEEGSRKTVVLNTLKRKQSEIEREIRDKENVAKRLDSEITRIIESERKKTVKSSGRAVLTPADQIVSSDFEKNRGRLPWPTAEGIVSGKYGEHEHPDFKSVKIRNDGIYISTSRGEDVRSIFRGVVSKVFSIPGENYTVIIKHGNYYTLYHNLVDVRVKAGQHVETKEILGKVFTDEETKETTLYFQIWKETERNDPELWLAN